MTNKPIQCPECGKTIGEYVYGFTLHAGGFIGDIPSYECKYDYKKASHIGFGRGAICKKCARTFFPEGIAYKVTNDYHGKRITPCVGIKQSGLFASRKDAQIAADECNHRSLSNLSQVEEVKV